MSAAEIRELNAAARWRGKFEMQRVPTLADVLRVAREKTMRCFLEIKASRDGATERAVAAAMRQGGAARHVVISFDEDILRRMRAEEPAVTLGLLTEARGRECIARAERIGARKILPREDCLTKELVDAARERGLGVVTWTVDEPARMKQLIAMNLEGIMTNYPERLSLVMKGIGEGK